MKAAKESFIFVSAALLFVLATATTPAAEHQAINFIDVTGFSSVSSETFINDWKIKTGSSAAEQTEYRLVIDEERGKVIQATAQASFAGLTREVEIDPASYPVITWSWKVSATIDSAKLSEKKGDDSPARLVVSFGRDFSKGGLPEASLCYAWSSREPEGSVIVNPYTSDIMVIVVASGDEKVGMWQQYRRNLVDDYRLAFGDEPAEVRAITIISDTDDTKEQLKAWYGTITFTAEETFNH